MPHLRHHRRHHTWPHCGSDLCMRQPRSPDPRISKPCISPTTQPVFWTVPAAMIVPLEADQPPDSDAEMAGIIGLPGARARHFWSRSARQRQDDNHNPLSPLAPEPRKQAHRNVLRRLVRRPLLGKAQSLIAVPTTMTARDHVVVSNRVPLRASVAPVVVAERTRPAWSAAEMDRLVSERRHRRCHSEQPRAWRRPSASLWTLREE
ncbi:hypothetical protein NUU61_008519 [Penicillium alfredii]|uniref:Uncharacterized protein n=1 Tax=Penicillium alfredii TaxID=1506179 RepID=A0A9W9JWE0_9EURO|nr:uncharacterized protein NUU61_008519 [Penicillium alfredii]KAJ5083940.1 hypothetical protein NUU61_008519 [Penicillium alfredii]